MNSRNSLLIFFLSTTICLLGCMGCQKEPINGKLDGQWEVLEVTPKSNNEIIKERLFYNFYMHVCQLSYYGGYFLDGNMNYNGEELWLEFPGMHDRNQILALQQYGIYENPVTFHVEYPKKNIMILNSEKVRIVLQKY